jgi:hypothetical protein
MKITDEVQQKVAHSLQSAAEYVDQELSPDRQEASGYYHGDPFGDEVDGRSKVVSRDVSDTVRAILPSLLRVFTGSEKALEYLPEGPEDVPLAEQATDYANWVLLRDNPGFLTLHSAFKDALIRKSGVFKSWWDDSIEVVVEDYEGLDDDALMLLEQDSEVTILEQVSTPDEAAQAEIQQQLMMMAQQAEQAGQPFEMPAELPQPMLHDVTVRRQRSRGRIRVEAVPPEEFLISRGARTLDDADVVAHRVEMTKGQLIAMGYDGDMLDEYAQSDELIRNEERMARHPEETVNNERPVKILYTEAWLQLEIEGGLEALHKVCCLGDGYKAVRVEPARFVPLAVLTPDPEPHRVIGSSVADLVMDIQRIKSSILRSMLDSLAQSIFPRTAAVEGEVNMDDLLNNEVGGIVRMRRPGMVMPMETPFVGDKAFGVLNYMDRIREQRTGITEATQGLSPETLQSTTRAAVQATVQAAQQQIEMIARIFAETGMRRLYRNLLKLIAQYQDKPRTIRLRGEWVTMDPRSWNAEMDVAVNSVLSPGLQEDRVLALTAIAEKQAEVLMQLGPNNPLVSLGQYSQTLSKMVEIAGFKATTDFFSDLPLDFQMPEPEQEQQSDPAMILAQVQMQEIQANIQKKQAELQLEQQKVAAQLELDREKMLRADDRERDRQEADVLLRAADIQAKHGMPVDVEQILRLMNRSRQEQFS